MIVLDSCALVEIVTRSDVGLALANFMLKNEKAISCDLVRVEVSSVIRKLARKQVVSADEAGTYLSEGLALVDEFVPIAELQAEALRESIRLDHSVYDLFYFVLARRTGATLFTTDRKLMELCLDNGVDCTCEIDL